MARRAYGLFLILLPFSVMFTFGSSAPAGRGVGVRRRPHPTLVGGLDDVVQERFSELTEEDYALGRFGSARTIPLVVAHSLNGETDEAWASRPLLHLSRAGWRSALFVAENRSGTRKADDRWLVGPITPEDDLWDYSPERSPLKALADRVVAERRAVRSEDGNVALEGRPIPASSPECLKCHPQKHLGDPIGAVIYAFAPKTPGAR